MLTPVVVVIVVALVVFLSRGAAARRRRMMTALGAQVARSLRSDETSPPGGANLGQSIADAVQKAFEEQGLSAGPVSVTASPAFPAGLSDPTAGIDHARLGIGEIVSVSSLSGARVAGVELDAIGSPKRRVTVDVPADAGLARGDRIYVQLDPADPNVARLVPNLRPPVTANRLDPLVLQPMLLAYGERGKGVVRSAEPIPVPPGAPFGGGAGGWRLELEVTPRGGFPYRAEIVTGVSTPEMAARICHAGAEVAVRYDPADAKTVMIDVAAMGLATAPAGASDLPDLASMGMIERIKAVREQTGLGLREAKDLAERMAADPVGLARILQAARTASATPPAINWNSLAGLTKVQKIATIRERTGVGLAQAKALVDAMDGAGLSATDRMVAMLSGRK